MERTLLAISPRPQFCHPISPRRSLLVPRRKSERRSRQPIYFSFDPELPLRGAPRWFPPSGVATPSSQAKHRRRNAILSARREVQILEANILPSGDEERIYLHDAPALSPAIHLSTWPWTSGEEEERGEGILFPLALISTARNGARLEITNIMTSTLLLGILCFSFFNLGPLVFHTISYEHTRPLFLSFSLSLRPFPARRPPRLPGSKVECRTRERVQKQGVPVVILVQERKVEKKYSARALSQSLTFSRARC